MPTLYATYSVKEDGRSLRALCASSQMNRQARYEYHSIHQKWLVKPVIDSGIPQTTILRLCRASTGGTRWSLVPELNTIIKLLERLQEEEQCTEGNAQEVCHHF